MAKKNKVVLYDTTLRDGTQAEDINFSVEDKVRLSHAFDELGLDYIEGGWPGSNPRDIEFFKKMRKVKLGNSELAAFGSTRRTKTKAKDDANVKALLASGATVATVFGKSWKLHVRKALKVSLEENLDMIFDTVDYLKKKLGTVFYDAEHFFDGYKDDPEYALKALRAAEAGGADCLVLCDTNGGVLPFVVSRVYGELRGELTTPLGIHAHNDSETAVANTLTAVKEGAVHVQGTINGFGERSGNANLCSVIPALQIKMGMSCLGVKQMKRLRETSQFVYEMANLPRRKHQPYVGESAFAHKGGIHVSAVMKNPETYEHIMPELVGNRQRVLVSDLSGRSNIIYKAKEYGLDIDSSSPVIKKLLVELKELENRGYQYEGAEASFELLLQKAFKKKEKYFTLLGFQVIDEKRDDDLEASAAATIRLAVDGVEEHTAAEGNGPVNALDKALRKALERFYPALKDVRLLDFKVRVIAGAKGTDSKVRVLVESGDGVSKWGTVGVSENVIEASWRALVDSIEYKLFKDKKNKKSTGRKPGV